MHDLLSQHRHLRIFSHFETSGSNTGRKLIPTFPHFLRNKAKGRISKRLFKENKARLVFRKTKISYPLIRTRTCDEFWTTVKNRENLISPQVHFIFQVTTGSCYAVFNSCSWDNRFYLHSTMPQLTHMCVTVSCWLMF